MPSTRASRKAGRVLLPRVARYRLALAFGLIVALVGAGGFLAGSLLPRSQAAAGLDETAPASVTANVESRVVQERRVVQGAVAPGTRTEVTYTQSGDEGLIPYVTTAGPTPGQPIHSGSLLLAIADTPFVALHVESPLYRSFRVGDTGEDVRAFETALASLVSGDYDVDDTFTENTMLAAEALWERLGFNLPTEEIAPPAAAGTSTPQPTPTAPSAPVFHSYVDVRQIVQLSSSSATVISTSEVGDLAGTEEPVAVLAGSSSHIAARVSIIDEAAFAVGTQVSVSTPGRVDAMATVVELGDFEVEPGEEENSTGAGRDAVISIPEGWDDLAEGTIVQTSPVDNAEPVLAVPLTAIRDAATSPYVIVQESQIHEPESRVDVTVLATGDGWAEVDPASGLTVGDSIRLTP